MKDAATQTAGRLRALPAPALPVEQLLLGKPVQEAAILLPRVFNLCRAAQEDAAARALGLEVRGTKVASEIIRDHLLKLFVSLPKFFGQAPSIRPAMMHDADAAIKALFGSAGLPQSAETMRDFRASGLGIAPLLQKIEGCFKPGEAVANGLPLIEWLPPMTRDAVENSPAGRRAEEAGLLDVEETFGRGPLWRVLGRAIDLVLTLRGDLPPSTTTEDGVALVSATRGRYAVQATVQDRLVTGFDRVTPTDHMLAPDGMLERALATLPSDGAGLAPLLLDILDPCSPVRLEEVQNA